MVFETGKVNESEIDIIIVGGGVAGASLAAVLGRDGRRVVVVERDLKTPDRIIGELLQPGGVATLTKLGLGDCLEGIDATHIDGYAIFLEGKQVQLTYPQVDGKSVFGRAMHHGPLVQNLRLRADALPNVEFREGSVHSLIEEGDRVVGIRYKASGAESYTELRAPLTAVCDGSTSILRKALSTAQPKARSHFAGVLLENAAQKIPFPHHGHVFLIKPSPMLCYPIGSGDVRVLVDIPGSLPGMEEIKNHLRTEIYPLLPDNMKPLFMDAVDSGRIRSMPNREMHGKPYRCNGAILLGDSFNCRHPLTGGGMTCVFNDVQIVRDCLRTVRDLNDQKKINKIVDEFYELRKPLAATINILAAALYTIFSAGGDPSLPYMRQACFDYFRIGGVCASGPMRLIAGLNPNYWSLIRHFFAVAIFGVTKTLLPLPLPGNIWRAFNIIKSATLIVKPLMAREKVLCWLTELGDRNYKSVCDV